MTGLRWTGKRYFQQKMLGIFEYFFSNLGAQGEAKEAYFCTLTAPSPKRDNELRKKAKKISGQAI